MLSEAVFNSIFDIPKKFFIGVQGGTFDELAEFSDVVFADVDHSVSGLFKLSGFDLK